MATLIVEAIDLIPQKPLDKTAESGYDIAREVPVQGEQSQTRRIRLAA